MTKFRFSFLALLFAPVLAFASGGGEMRAANVDLDDKAAMQRGAGLFMSYCSGCHSLKFQRYSRMAEDLGLSQEDVEQYLLRGNAKFGDTMTFGMDKAQGEAWLGKAPPDLSLIARAKPGGPNWLYTFLHEFYVDESRPSGWNNKMLANTSMPNVLWEMQGIQRATEFDKDGKATHLELISPGSMSVEEYDRAVRDLTAFLTYVGEPAALQRTSLGVWVILFLAFLTLLAWLLKAEYWRDVH